jgi:hypothetical protein
LDWLRNQRPDLKGEFAMHCLEPKFALYLINERRIANRDRLRPSIISPQLSGKRFAYPFAVCSLKICHFRKATNPLKGRDR